MCLAQSNPHRHSFILEETNAVTANRLWDLPKGKIVTRTADKIAHSVSCLLKN